MIDGELERAGFGAAPASAVVAGPRAISDSWNWVGLQGGSLTSEVAWKRVGECKQTEIEEQENRNIVPFGVFLLLSKPPPPHFLRCGFTRLSRLTRTPADLTLQPQPPAHLTSYLP